MIAPTCAFERSDQDRTTRRFPRSSRASLRLNLGFGGEDGGGIYHSIYDDFYWYTHFSDTDFSYGRALAQTAGTTVMRLADADLLPFDFQNLADTIHHYVDELQKLLKAKQDEITERNKEIEEGVFTATADPKKTSVPPPVEGVPPYLNFAALLNASDALNHSAERYQKALEKITKNGDLTLSTSSLQTINSQLMQSERKLTSPDGLTSPPVVPAPDLRSRCLHRIWGQDHSGRSRGHRTEKLERSRRADGTGRKRAARRGNICGFHSSTVGKSTVTVFRSTVCDVRPSTTISPITIYPATLTNPWPGHLNGT